MAADEEDRSGYRGGVLAILIGSMESDTLDAGVVGHVLLVLLDGAAFDCQRPAASSTLLRALRVNFKSNGMGYLLFVPRAVMPGTDQMVKEIGKRISRFKPICVIRAIS